ncbi:hypothetical protein VNO78_03286 [Psophocarpus tetragonolobus]|uniref:Uncharacterized protein n=1 Tax=Psophocarpus tetragonolobus TaxID=3891 RepID=A0AAN9XVZ4_PSOTE
MPTLVELREGYHYKSNVLVFIFEWMQNRINGSNGKKKQSDSISTTYYTRHEPCKQEFSDWPQALLAIGTFGGNNMKEDSGGRSNKTAEDSPCFQDITQEITYEDVGSLQNEFSLFFKGRVEPNLESEQEHTNDLMKERFNNENSSLEPQDKENESPCDGSNINRGNSYPTNSIISSRGKDCYLDHSSKRGVGKKSLSFLLKKMLACNSGFQPTPFLKDPLSTESRMEKILRAILHKKIYPQGSCSTPSFVKKYLETRPISQFDDDDSEDEEELAIAAENGSKWVKTDSEYIIGFFSCTTDYTAQPCTWKVVAETARKIK